LKINGKILKCDSNGLPLLTKVIRMYFKIQKNNKLKESRKTKILNKLYNIIKERSSEEIKNAARKELTKSYIDNVYSLYCNYIILTGEL
jgi:predicted RNA binding protein with dsRBD fold (UPF0201 family)